MKDEDTYYIYNVNPHMGTNHADLYFDGWVTMMCVTKEYPIEPIYPLCHFSFKEEIEESEYKRIADHIGYKLVDKRKFIPKTGKKLNKPKTKKKVK